MTQSVHDTFHRGLDLEREAQFHKAKAIYEDILRHVTDETVLEKVQRRMEDMDALMAEKAVYRRIDENARQVLTQIGVNIIGNQTLFDLLMDAGAVNLDSQTALFIPLTQDYVDRCLEIVPRKLPADPGMNAFGIGAVSPFLKRTEDDELRPANRGEYEQIILEVSAQQDVVGIFSLPVACDKSISLFEVARLMEKGYSGLKMITTNTMRDDEVAYFNGRGDWLDGTSLMTSLSPMNNMVAPFLRSARAGNNLLLVDQSIAGISAPGSPEAFLTFVHAQVLFMMVVAQTVKPGISCVHCGIPSVVGAGGNIDYSSPHQTFINAALARVNTWVTGFPSSQTGGSTSLSEVNDRALRDSELSRNAMLKYGVHILRHAMGALGSLNFFSLEKFIKDCRRERHARAVYESIPKNFGVNPMFFPADDHALAGIREMLEKGGPKNADHTLRHVNSFFLWEESIKAAARKKPYCPQLNDIVLDSVSGNG